MREVAGKRAARRARGMVRLVTMVVKRHIGRAFRGKIAEDLLWVPSSNNYDIALGQDWTMVGAEWRW